MKKCFGIISWFPDKEPARAQRQDRINRLFTQLNDLWPDVDILIIAQNWKDFKPVKTKNKQIIKEYPALGILKARRTLREEFLKLDYDYIIMFDDDAIIKCENKHAHKDYMAEIDKHPGGFCFIHGKKNRWDDYKAAQLNLCAISREIYEKENIPLVDPQQNQGFEDHIYSLLLHVKYGDKEFLPPTTITHIQFQNHQEEAPSTWARGKGVKCSLNARHTDTLIQYLFEHRDLPNLAAYYSHEKFEQEKAKKINAVDGHRIGVYLYF